MTDVANPAADPAAAVEVTAGGRSARKLNGAKAPKRTKASEPHPAAKPKTPTKAAKKASAPVAAPSPAARDVLVPLDELVLSAANVRRVFHEDGVSVFRRVGP